MPPPVVNSISPASGLSIGENCVTISGSGFAVPSLGGFVRVYFGGVEATEGGAIDPTTIIVLTPPGVLGDVDVIVENWIAGDPPTLDGSSITLAGFAYQRPNLQTNRDLAASQDSVLTVVTRELVSELRRTVIENTHHDMHPEYVDDVSAGQGQEVQSTTPNLKIVGPSVSEDRFYALNGNFDVETVGGFNVSTQPVTVRLDYRYVGVARTKGEAFNLWNALTLFLDRKIFLDVARDGSNKANGVISFELNPTWQERAELTTTTRHGFYQFSGALHLRGVHAVSRTVCPGRRVDETNVVTEAIQPT